MERRVWVSLHFNEESVFTPTSAQNNKMVLVLFSSSWKKETKHMTAGRKPICWLESFPAFSWSIWADGATTTPLSPASNRLSQTLPATLPLKKPWRSNPQCLCRTRSFFNSAVFYGTATMPHFCHRFKYHMLQKQKVSFSLSVCRCLLSLCQMVWIYNQLEFIDHDWSHLFILHGHSFQSLFPLDAFVLHPFVWFDRLAWIKSVNFFQSNLTPGFQQKHFQAVLGCSI